MDHGWVYLVGKYRPFRQWRVARALGGIQRVAVVVGGKEILVDRERVKRFPNKKED